MDKDVEVRDDVLAELAFEPSLDEAAVGVSVHDGIVTLSGHVKSYSERNAAEAATRRVKGVRGLVQKLEVRLPADIVHDDEEIARRAANYLQWSVYPRLDDLKIKVEKGRVTLDGRAERYAQRVDAERLIQNLSGVTGVTNRISVKPSTAKAPAVRAEIEKAFKRNAELESSNISISVDGGKVRLDGKVKAYYERALAERAAWSTPGVTAVDDRLNVGG
jgi:osmotically-inducible protein OsmY